MTEEYSHWNHTWSFFVSSGWCCVSPVCLNRAAALTVMRDGKPWGFMMISGQIPVSQNGMSSWGTISPHTPAEEKTFQSTEQQTTSRADAHHQIFFGVFLLLSFSWITFYPDSLPWPVLPTCRLEESPCDRTGKISIPLHNVPSDLWVSKSVKKGFGSYFQKQLETSVQ